MDIMLPGNVSWINSMDYYLLIVFGKQSTRYRHSISASNVLLMIAANPVDVVFGDGGREEEGVCSPVVLGPWIYLERTHRQRCTSTQSSQLIVAFTSVYCSSMGRRLIRPRNPSRRHTKRRLPMELHNSLPPKTKRNPNIRQSSNSSHIHRHPL
jgi:hypothetical protein